MNLIIKDKVTDMIHKENLFIQGTFFNDLEKSLLKIINSSIKRAKANERKTIMSKDLPTII